MIIIIHVTASVGSAATARRPATAIGRDSLPSCQRRKKHRRLRGIALAQRPTYSGVAMAAGRGTVQSLKEGEKEKGEEERRPWRRGPRTVAPGWARIVGISTGWWLAMARAWGHAQLL
jgi:hypothetical protein